MNENYVSEINGYLVKDKKIRESIVSIETEEAEIILTEYTEGQPVLTTDIVINLPEGFNINNTYIVGGEYFIYDLNNELVGKRPIGENFYSGTAQSNPSFYSSYGFLQNQVYLTFENFIQNWVGYKVKAKILLIKN